MHRSVALVSLLALTACGEMGLATSGIGVTPGGTQDMNYARDLIEQGRVPTEGSFTAEGLFSEHDLPLSGEACADLLCPRAAAAVIDPVDDAGERLLVQLGFGSELQTVERPDLDIAVAIDISCSMSGGKLDTSKEALLELIDQLGPADQLALITFGSRAKTVKRLTVMDAGGKRALRNAVEDVTDKGSTAMEDGLEEAIGELERRGREGYSQRIFLLTDAQPNVGSTGVGSFVGIASDAADDDIGVTVWGVGLDLGAELVAEMSKLRGGNAYHFVDVGSMTERVREEFDFMVTPLAYDLEVHGTALEGLEVQRPWGAPTDPSGDVSFGAATLFPSNRDGGMGVTVAFADGTPLEALPVGEDVMTLTASWTEVDGPDREASIDVPWLGGEAFSDPWTRADDEGVLRMGALIDELLALEAGAAFCAGELGEEEAAARIDEAAVRLGKRSLDDPALQREAELMEQLLLNLEGGDASCG